MTRPALQLLGLTTSGHVVRPHTRVGMTFYPQALSGGAARNTSAIPVIWDGKRTHGTLLSFQWQKRLGQPGSWSATIKDPARYSLDVAGGDVLVGDWVDLSVVRNGLQFPLGRGRVENVRKQTRTEAGARVLTWQVSGRDHAGCLEYPIAYTNIWARKLEECVGGFFTRRVRGQIGGSPGRMFSTLWSAGLGSGTDSSTWELPSALVSALQRSGLMVAGGATPAGVYDMVAPTVYPTRGGYFNEPVLWTAGGQTMRGLLEQWCNPLLNEQLFDVDLPSAPTAGQPAAFRSTAIIRERPFVLADSSLAFSDQYGSIQTGTQSPWFQLPTTTIPAWALDTEDIGTSDAERLNLFQLIANIGFGGSETDQMAMNYPRWDKASIRSHGLRIMQQRTPYCADASKGKGKGQGEWVKEWRAWQALLVQWYCMNAAFLQGVIGVRLALPEVRVGSRLKIDTGATADSVTYYVEGVSLSVQAGKSGGDPPRGETQIQVTRGYPGSDQSIVSAVSKAAQSFTELV